MHLSELRLWNYRKFGKAEWDLEKPHLAVPFKKGLNVLIGENDSGKTAILDAIKLVLKTHAYEWIRISSEDFYTGSNKLRIELLFRGLKDEEAKNFIEWLGWEEDSEGNKSPVFRLIYEVEKKENNILPTTVRAGMDDFGFPLNSEAADLLKITHLKALRDASHELIAKKNSRVSQILQGHDLFKPLDGGNHDFEEWLGEVNEKIEEWFKDENKLLSGKSNKEQIKDIIDYFLHQFIEETFDSNLTLTEPSIKSILEKISLEIADKKNLGLGTLNRLYMAIELLHLKKEWNGLKLCLIEELEAHLHPQAQMKVAETIQKESEVQFILTSHSPNLTSKVEIDNLIMCKNMDAFPLGREYTKLKPKNYTFLERFLDVTKSNLFFARGVILVEGWSEAILIPVIAKNIGLDLIKKEVSIINVGSTAYLHFAKIFLREDGKSMGIPVSIITDLDIRPDESGNFDQEKEKEKYEKLNSKFIDPEGPIIQSDIKLCIAEQWTLEWCLYKSSVVTELFKESVLKVHSGTDEFKKDGEKWKPGFEEKLIEKLKSSSNPLKKVKIASEMAIAIEKSGDLNLVGDEYLSYIIDAIKHACGIKIEEVDSKE